ncbi:MAG: ATP-binding cassette domain-containing protein [Bacteroidetes bacterium]|nr:ATP-binding cassette domain-containing protein [Bacteroidota bacterium]
MLEVHKLRKDFTGIRAVDDVSFSVKEGQIFGLIGPNGAGKSTTIRMIMDIIQPDAGRVSIDGQPMNEGLKNIIGYLPEERGLYRKNKLSHVIAYFGGLKGLRSDEALEKARPLLEHFSLTHYENRNVEELSKGNQQKVQFIIAILHEPRLLVLDELFSGLDPVNQVLMKDALLQLKSDNRAIIFSTHQMDQAEKLCDELMMIDKGRTVLHGAPSAIKQHYGKNALHVEFTGDGGFLRDMPGVRSIDLAQNYAEIELEDDVRTNTIIETMLPRLALHHVARIEPSLQSIFIDIVGQSNVETSGDAETVAPAPAQRPAVMKSPKVRKQFVSGIIYLIAGAIIALQLKDGFDPVAMLFVLIAFAGSMFSFLKFAKLKRELVYGDHLQEEDRR